MATIINNPTDTRPVVVDNSPVGIVVGLLVQIGFGLLGRLMPQVQIFFLAMPLQIFLSLVLLAMTAGWSAASAASPVKVVSFSSILTEIATEVGGSAVTVVEMTGTCANCSAG